MESLYPHITIALTVLALLELNRFFGSEWKSCAEVLARREDLGDALLSVLLLLAQLVVPIVAASVLAFYAERYGFIDQTAARYLSLVVPLLGIAVTGLTVRDLLKHVRYLNRNHLASA